MAYHRSYFGIGSITAIPSGTNVTPSDLAVVRGATVEFKTTDKPLKGNMMAPLDSATADLMVTGKIQAADFSADLISLVVPGTTTATGRAKMAVESSAIPGTPFQITVTQSANFLTNLGVIDLTTGKRMKVGATASGTGIYAYSAGVYTFNTADSTHTVQIRYAYNDASTGTTVTSTNQAVGATSGYGLYLFDPAGGTKEEGIYIPSVKFPSLSLTLKSDDWTESGLDFTAYADASGKLFYAYVDE